MKVNVNRINVNNKKNVLMEYSEVIVSIIPPIEPAALLPSPIAIYQRPNIIPIFVAGTNLETYDNPTGDKLNSPKVCNKYAKINQIILTDAVCAP